MLRSFRLASLSRKRLYKCWGRQYYIEMQFTVKVNSILLYVVIRCDKHFYLFSLKKDEDYLEILTHLL